MARRLSLTVALFALIMLLFYSVEAGTPEILILMGLLLAGLVAIWRPRRKV